MFTQYLSKYYYSISYTLVIDFAVATNVESFVHSKLLYSSVLLFYESDAHVIVSGIHYTHCSYAHFNNARIALLFDLSTCYGGVARP